MRFGRDWLPDRDVRGTADPSASLPRHAGAGGMTKERVRFDRDWLPDRKSCPSSAVVSHISRKTSEMWGPPEVLLTVQKAGKDRPLMGLRPVVFDPCTLVRTWGTRPVWEVGALSSPSLRRFALAALAFVCCGIGGLGRLSQSVCRNGRLARPGWSAWCRPGLRRRVAGSDRGRR